MNDISVNSSSHSESSSTVLMDTVQNNNTSSDEICSKQVQYQIPLVFEDPPLTFQEQAKIDKLAWQRTSEVELWIWKCIRGRNVPSQDMQDVFHLCQIEVFKLMKRYNPNYSKVSWANYGVLKAFKEYESNNGVVRLPFHVLEKMGALRKKMKEFEQQGKRMTPEVMEEVTRMRLVDIMTAQERWITVDAPDNNQSYFEERMPSDCDEPHYLMVNGEPQVVEETVIANELRGLMYKCLFSLSCMELFVVILRYGLETANCPHFFEFREGGLLDLSIEKGDTYPLQAIGDRLGITRERVRQIERSALEKMRQSMGDNPEGE